VRVAGVDLAAEPVRTAVAVLGWDDGKAVVEDLRIGADDEAVLAALAAVDKAGIDASFGWPNISSRSWGVLWSRTCADHPVLSGWTRRSARTLPHRARKHVLSTVVPTFAGYIPAIAVASTDRLMPASVRRRPRSNRPGDAMTAAFANA
jgi:hypothetical protein